MARHPRALRLGPGFRLIPSRLWTVPRLRLAVPQPDQRAPVTGPDATDVWTASIDGLACTACAGRSQEALRAVPGVREAHVDLDSGLVQLRVDAAAPPQPAALRAAVGRIVVLPRARRMLAALRAAGSRLPRPGRARGGSA